MSSYIPTSQASEKFDLVLDSLPQAHRPKLSDRYFSRRSVGGIQPSHITNTYGDTTLGSNPGALLDSLAALHITGTATPVTLTERVARGSLGAVYRASIGADTTPSRLIVKIATDTDKIVLLQHEAIIYRHAEHLQGDILPHCYGFYENQAQDAACMLLEDCGQPFAGAFEEASPDTKLSVLRAIKRLHEAGVEHGDLNPWNILNHNGSPRVVDLHLAMVHACPARNIVITEEFCFREAVPELLCDELITIGENLEFGSQDAVMYFGDS